MKRSGKVIHKVEDIKVTRKCDELRKYTELDQVKRPSQCSLRKEITFRPTLINEVDIPIKIFISKQKSE